MANKILIIQTAFIGDALLSIPLQKNLRQKYPDAEITYLCRKGMGDFLNNLGFVDFVVELDKTQPNNFSEVKKYLGSKKWDWIICPHESIRSMILVHGLKAKRKTSYKNILNIFTFNERIQRPMDLPEALRTLALLQNSQPELKTTFDDFRKVSDREFEIDFEMPQAMMREIGLKISAHKNTVRQFRDVPPELSMEVDYFARIRKSRRPHSEKVKAMLAQAGLKKIFVVAPGSVWETKKWRREYYRELCEELTADHFVILIGGPGERELCQNLTEGLSNIYNAAGETSLWDSAEILACADQVLTNDSGTMHLASLSSAKTLAIFGPTTLDQGYRPWNNQARTIESSLYCRPCGKHGAKKCPLKHHACMRLVYVDHVLSVIEPQQTKSSSIH